MQHSITRRTRLALAVCATGALAGLSLAAPAGAAPLGATDGSVPASAATAAAAGTAGLTVGGQLGNGSDRLTRSDSGAVESVTPQGVAPTVSSNAVTRQLATSFKADASSSFTKVRGQALGKGSISRFQQVIDGRVVAGSSIANTLDANGKLVQSMGNVATATKGSFPAAAVLDANAATATATAKQAAAKSGLSGTVTTRLKDTVWFAPAVAGTTVGAAGAAATTAQPAFQISVSTPTSGYLVTVSATNPSHVLANTPTTFEIKRVVCDAKRYKAVVDADLKCGTGLRNAPARTEGQAASTIADVNSVYNFFGDTSAFYAANTRAGDLTTLVGANYNDGQGKAIRGSVRQCISGDACPYTNAFWSDELSAMVYGEGVTTDDITGHELTHGITSKTNGLVYQNEAGAINESMSDIFGEFVDLGNGSADDTAANRWKMGEGSSLGAIRDMKTPKTYQQPDTYKGSYWVATTSSPTDTNDYGGVHTNSGVGNKLAQLMVDGGTLNSTTVTGIGVAKSAQIYWTAQTLITSNATYSTLATALKQACTANVTNGIAGTTTANCTQVANAIKAVKIP